MNRQAHGLRPIDGVLRLRGRHVCGRRVKQLNFQPAFGSKKSQETTVQSAGICNAKTIVLGRVFEHVSQTL